MNEADSCMKNVEQRKNRILDRWASTRAHELWDGIYLVYRSGDSVEDGWYVRLHSATGPLHRMNNAGRPVCHDRCRN